jgi:hypothetical protein
MRIASGSFNVIGFSTSQELPFSGIILNYLNFNNLRIDQRAAKQKHTA